MRGKFDILYIKKIYIQCRCFERETSNEIRLFNTNNKDKRVQLFYEKLGNQDQNLEYIKLEDFFLHNVNMLMI